MKPRLYPHLNIPRRKYIIFDIKEELKSIKPLNTPLKNISRFRKYKKIIFLSCASMDMMKYQVIVHMDGRVVEYMNVRY